MDKKIKFNKQKRTNRFKKASIIFGFVVAFLLVMSNIQLQLNNEGSWKIVWDGNLVSAAENDPGSGASGFLEFFIINHSATPATAYNENDSAVLEGWCTAANLGYASADNFNIEVAHSVTFDIVVRVRFNKTNCWDGAKFIGSRTRVNITCSGDLVISDVTGTNVESYNNTGQNFIWINVYWDNGGAGYSINADDTFDVSEISIEAKY